jgi:hypothetical protein
VTAAAASALLAGPEMTEPSFTENKEPWQVQTIAPFVISDTGQPWCVQTLLNAL